MFLRTLIAVTAVSAIAATAWSPSQASTSASDTGTPSAHVSKIATEAPAQARVRTKAEIYSAQLAVAMNDVRRKRHLVPLRVRPCLGGYATRWARHLARTGQFEHQNLSPILRACELSRVGEILAKGNVTPRYMISMWLHSPGHRALLLDPNFRKAGVSARRGADGAWVGCIDFGRG